MAGRLDACERARIEVLLAEGFSDARIAPAQEPQPGRPLGPVGTVVAFVQVFIGLFAAWVYFSAC